MKDLCVSFGLTLRQLRKARRWSQEILAENAGLNRSYIGEVERGEAVPSLLTVEKLARATGLSMADLLAHCERLRHVPSPRETKDEKLTSIAC
jgi:transcriptional regulator with XRE-family HTH domain